MVKQRMALSNKSTMKIKIITDERNILEQFKIETQRISNSYFGFALE